MYSHEASRYPLSRWAILAIGWIVQFCVAWSWFLVPSVGYALFSDLGLTHSQFTMILTAPLISGMFIGLVGGGFGDRYGIRLAIGIGVFLSGVAGLSRAFVPNFFGLFILTLLMGVSNGFLMPNLSKLVSIWFPPRQVGMATGIYISSQAVGFSMGLLTAPLFSNWRLAFFYVGIITLAVATLWILSARNAPKSISVTKTEIISSIIKGIKSKNILLACTVVFLVMGSFISFSGNLPKALLDVHDVGAETAGAISSFITWGALVGTIILPIISDKFRIRKPFIYIGTLITGACYYLAWHLAPESYMTILIFIGGLFQGGVVSIVFTQIIELPEIRSEHVGGAAGLVSSCGQMGGVIIPLWVISPLIASTSSNAYMTGFVVVAILFAAAMLPAVFITETGSHK